MEKPETRARKVGVYDRPASADRARYIRVIVFVTAIVVSVVGLVVFLMSQADRRSRVTDAQTAEIREPRTSWTSGHDGEVHFGLAAAAERTS